MDNTHYVCTGECQGIASQAGVCQADTCAKKGQPLEACTCDNPAHQPATEPMAASSDTPAEPAPAAADASGTPATE